MSHSSDPLEHPSQDSSEHPSQDIFSHQPRTIIEEHGSSDSDATSRRTSSRSRSLTPAQVFGPANRYGLRGRVTARKSVPIPIRRTFHIPLRDDAGPSRTGNWSRTPTPSPPPPEERAPTPRHAQLDPIDRLQLTNLTHNMEFHRTMLGHHDHTIDSLVAMMGASSQTMHRVIDVLSHTMASVHRLYMIVYLLMAVLVFMFGWMVLGPRF